MERAVRAFIEDHGKASRHQRKDAEKLARNIEEAI